MRVGFQPLCFPIPWPGFLIKDPPCHPHPWLLQPSCCLGSHKGFASPSSPHSKVGWGRGGIPLTKMSYGCWEGSAWGGLHRGIASKRDLACLIFASVDCPSICSLWRWRGRVPCGCSIAFPYFFNIEKISFKNCDFFFKSFGWREGKRETPKAVTWLTGDT